MRSYTTAEYRKAGRGAGPFALEANPNHNYREGRRTPVLGGVMHITAGLSDYDLPDVSAEGTTNYGATTIRQASWHVCIDSDGIIPAIRDEWTAWCAGVTDIANTNDATLNMEIGTGSTDWRKKPAGWVDRTIRNAAVWWAPRVIAFGIPLRVENDRAAIESAILARRKFGFTSHKIIAPHNRTDPGWVDTNSNGVADLDTFPWSMFFDYLREEIALRNGTTTAPEEDIMATIDDLRKVIREEAGRAVWTTVLTSFDPDPDDGVTPRDWQASAHAVMANWRGSDNQIKLATVIKMLVDISAKVGVDVDEAAIASGILAGLVPAVRDAVLAAGQPEAVAEAVVAKLAAKLGPPPPPAA